jgi:hypothetical protein
MRQMNNQIAGFSVWADAAIFVAMGKRWALAGFHYPMPDYAYVVSSPGESGVWRKVFGRIYHRISTDLKPDLYEEKE